MSVDGTFEAEDLPQCLPSEDELQFTLEDHVDAEQGVDGVNHKSGDPGLRLSIGGRSG